MRIEQDRLSAAQFKDLFKSVGWQAPSLEQIEVALSNSMAVFCAYDDEIPVGMIRLIGDGGMSVYVKDFAIRPQY